MCERVDNGEVMMRKLATTRTVIETKHIDGAGMIELAVVDGWKCFTKKGEYTIGDLLRNRFVFAGVGRV